MPLVIITGHPASGKTTRAEALASSLREIISQSTNPTHRSLEVAIVNDESLGLNRSAYGESRTEKQARATFSSAVKRLLGRERIVIADGMNYIKGFRYQMYCEAKAARTPSCCLHVATSAPFEHELNAKIECLAPGTAYSNEVLENLIFRFEEPSAFARWDSPLFTLPASDPSPPAIAIFHALIGDGPKTDDGPGSTDTALKEVRPNLATVAPQQTDANALQRIDQVCAGVIKTIQDWATNRGTDAEANIPVSDDANGSTPCIVMPAGGFTVAGLQRLRREFVGLMRSNPTMGAKDAGGIKAEFVSFVNRRTWEE